MRVRLITAFLFVFFLISCATDETPASELQIVNVYASAATRPWLTEVYNCAPAGTVVSAAGDPTLADISLRLGEPRFLPASAYQIDTEEILIVTHRLSPVQNLTLEEARALFAGQGDPSVLVWVYASGEDTQRVFEQAVMQGRSVTSSARLATSPQHMSDTLNNEPNSVGILPRRWKAGDVRDVLTIPDVPVLAIANTEAQGVVRDLLACLQKEGG